MNPAEIMAILQVVAYAAGVVKEMIDVADRTVEILKAAHAEKRDLNEAEVSEVKLRRDAANLRLKRALEFLESQNLDVKKPND